jgi:arginase
MGLGPAKIFSGLTALFKGLPIELDSEEIKLDSPYPAEISAAFELGGKVAECVRECRSQGKFPIVLSGNCNASLGTFSGCGAGRTGIVWFDGHGEATTPATTRSGFLDGMPIATLLGKAWQTLARSVPGFISVSGKRIVLFGARQVEPAERVLLKKAGVRRPQTIEALQKDLVALAKEVRQVYLHVDLDVLDPREATANQWTPPGGISVELLLKAVAEVCKHVRVAALGVASYDPKMDHSKRALATARAVVKTVLTCDPGDK